MRTAAIVTLIKSLSKHWTRGAAAEQFQAAITRKAWLLEKGQPDGRHHEPLEWFGDRVLDLVIAQELLRRYPGRDEGAYDATRAFLVGESHLADLARRFELLPIIRMGHGEEKRGQVEWDGPLSDHLEALCGAAFLVGGWKGAEAFVLALFEDAWPTELRASSLAEQGESGEMHPMSELTQLVNLIWKTSLDRDRDWDVEATGPDDRRLHTATVTLPPHPDTGEREAFTGPTVQGTEKKAKAAAAREALPYLRRLAGW